MNFSQNSKNPNFVITEIANFIRTRKKNRFFFTITKNIQFIARFIQEFFFIKGIQNNENVKCICAAYLIDHGYPQHLDTYQPYAFF